METTARSLELALKTIKTSTRNG